MAATRDELDPYLHDPDHWGVSLAQMGEVIIACLDAVRAQSVAEIGAFAGDLTRVLVRWADMVGARVVAIDPDPEPGLLALESESSRLELIRRTSLEALPEIELPDVVIIDGDHNYFTVSRELALIADRADADALPLLLFHDVCWPHGRRDDYFDPQQIPPEERHPTVGAGSGISPGNPGVDPAGLPYPRSAAHEGGPRNGVLTAVEDFVAAREDLRLAVVPAFFGFGAVWSRGAPWSAELAAVLEPWDRNPVLQRLEENRVRALAARHAARVEAWGLRDRYARQHALLERLLVSSAFAVAERLSSLRVRLGVASDQSAISKAEIRAVLEDPERG